MICIVQRVTSASVRVEGQIVGEIGPGLLVLAAVEREDTVQDVAWTAQKLLGLRIFRNGEKHFDQDVQQVGGSLLVVSNFTVAASTRHGRRPSLDGAAAPEAGRVLFDRLVEELRAGGVPVQTGQYGAHMQLELINDGPASFLVNSRD